MLPADNASGILGEDMRYNVYDYEHRHLPVVPGVSGRSKRTLGEDDLPVYERVYKRRKEENEKELQDHKDEKAREAMLVKRNAALKKHEEPKWKVFRISQSSNNDYDTYGAAIVVAQSEGDARMIHPGGGPNADRVSEVHRMEKWVKHAESHYKNLGPMPGWYSPESAWVYPAFVEVEFISSYDGDPMYHNSTLSSVFRAG